MYIIHKCKNVYYTFLFIYCIHIKYAINEYEPRRLFAGINGHSGSIPPGGGIGGLR